MEAGSVYEFLAKAYAAKDDKPAAEKELQTLRESGGGADPATLKTLADDLTADGNRKEAASVLERVNYIYPMDGAQHQQLGLLFARPPEPCRGPFGNSGRFSPRDPIDPAQGPLQPGASI
ncbi:MAG: hypothetical protein WDO73_15645 [Ignavibacteriota bacterium]